MKNCILCLLSLLYTVSGPAAFVPISNYPYPYEDPYYASITSQFARLPNSASLFKTDHLELFPKRKKIAFFKDENKLKFGFYEHDNAKAPLVFMIAGTGGSHLSSGNVLLGSFFKSLGCHVVLLPSPFHLNFIIGANALATAGVTQTDAQYLHQVMRLVLQRLKTKSDISPKEFWLSGYSLGALEAAFVAHLDSEKEKFFNFKKVLLVNPPLRLDVSAQIIDHLFGAVVKLGPERQKHLTKKVYFTAFKFENNPPKLDFLLQKESLPYPFSPLEIKALIAQSFRSTLAHSILAKELLNPNGLVAANTLKQISPTKAVLEASRYGFIDYFNLVALPSWNLQSGRTAILQDVVHEHSLIGIADYLKKHPHIYLAHNADDIILGKNEIQEFEKIFGQRAVIFPRGGHMGNLWYPLTYQYLSALLQK